MFCEPKYNFNTYLIMKYDDDTEDSYDELVETIIRKYDKPLIWRFSNYYLKKSYNEHIENLNNEDFKDSFFIIYDIDGFICLDVGYIYEYGTFERWGEDLQGCRFFSEGYAFCYRKCMHVTGRNKLRSLYFKLKYIKSDYLSKNIIFEESFKNGFTSIKINDKEIFYKLVCSEDEYVYDDGIKFINDEAKELFIKEFYNIHIEYLNKKN